MGKITKEKIQSWIKNSVESMLTDENGTVYFYNIKGGISFMLAWTDGSAATPENKFCDGYYTIEASVRKTGSSFLTQDWTYIGEGRALQPSDESNHFAAIADWLFNAGAVYLRFEIYYMLPNNKQIELLSEMQTANYDLGDFDEPIANLRRTYQEAMAEDELMITTQQIEAQCFAFANFLGTQYEEIQSQISIDNLSVEIKEALLKDLN